MQLGHCEPPQDPAGRYGAAESGPQGPGDLDLDEAALRAELPRDQVTKAAVRLIDSGYVTGTITRLGSEPEPAVIVSRLTERGLRAVGIWPSGDDDMLASLLQLLDELAGAAPDPEQASRWHRLRDGLVGAGGTVTTGLLTAWLQRQSGL